MRSVQNIDYGPPPAPYEVPTPAAPVQTEVMSSGSPLSQTQLPPQTAKTKGDPKPKADPKPPRDPLSPNALALAALSLSLAWSIAFAALAKVAIGVPIVLIAAWIASLILLAIAHQSRDRLLRQGSVLTLHSAFGGLCLYLVFVALI